MKKTACFTGHRSILDNIEDFSNKLYDVVERLITEYNLTDFFVGGAYGFDAVASLSVLKLRMKYPHIKLHLILPCSNDEQTKNWTADRIADFKHILELADTVEYTSNSYYNGCMKVRNARLMECASECCICYYNPCNWRSGTGQTVRMAQRKGIEIINVYEQ